MISCQALLSVESQTHIKFIQPPIGKDESATFEILNVFFVDLVIWGFILFSFFFKLFVLLLLYYLCIRKISQFKFPSVSHFTSLAVSLWILPRTDSPA